MTLIGWCPGGRPVDTMLKTYQGTGVARIFVSAGKSMPAWDGPVLAPLVAAGVAIHLSYKTNSLSEVLPWAGRKPASVLLWLTEDHEPEQGPDAGDPTLEEYHASQAALVAAFDGHPMRDEIWLGPVFTRYWWQKVAGDRRWMPRVPVDFIGWDVYSSESDRYRTPDDLLTIPRQIAAETGVPYLVAELGAVRIASDTDGSGQAAWMRAMVDAVKGDGALTCCWYHKEGWDLLASGAELARQTWQTIIREETPVATTAPQTLLDARQLLLTYLNVEKDTVRSQDLEPAEVGIVGDPNHRGGYHCGEDRVVPNDYSVVESSRDRLGLTSKASALDVGTFSYRDALGRTHNLQTFSVWCVAQCVAGAPDTRDIREIIYSPDGTTVKRWDRLGKRAGGDSSHLFHTHFSFFRDAIKAGRDQTPLFRRYLTSIGLIEGDDDMDQATFDKLLKGALTGDTADAIAVQNTIRALPWRYPVTPTMSALNVLFGQQMALPQLAAAVKTIGEAVARESSSPDEIRALLAELPKPEPVDVGQFASAVVEQLRAELAELPAGSVTAEQVEGAAERGVRRALGSLDGATPQS